MNHTEASRRMQEIEQSLKDNNDFGEMPSDQIDSLLKEADECQKALEQRTTATKMLDADDIAWLVVTAQAYKEVSRELDKAPYDYTERLFNQLQMMDDDTRWLCVHLRYKHDREQADCDFQRGWDMAKEADWS